MKIWGKDSINSPRTHVVRSSPLSPERGSASTTVYTNFVKHSLQVCLHPFIGESQCTDSKTLEHEISVCIILFTAMMNCAIEFNNKLFFMTIEVGNEEKVVAVDGLVNQWMLPIEL